MISQTHTHTHSNTHTHTHADFERMHLKCTDHTQQRRRHVHLIHLFTLRVCVANTWHLQSICVWYDRLFGFMCWFFSVCEWILLWLDVRVVCVCVLQGWMSHTHTHARTHTHTQLLTHTLTHSHTHTLTRAHTHSHSTTHTLTHTHTQRT